MEVRGKLAIKILQAFILVTHAEMYKNIVTLLPNLNTYQRKPSSRSQNASAAHIGIYGTLKCMYVPMYACIECECSRDV